LSLFGLDDDAPESGDDADDDVADAAGDRPTVGVETDANDALIPMALSLFSLLPQPSSSAERSRTFASSSA
jgi:hypothetical protein